MLSFYYDEIKTFLCTFGDVTSIQGIKYITNKDRSLIEIVMWLLIVIMALFGVIFLSIGTWQRYQENPTVISIERDRFSWNTTFPSATLCPIDKINTQKLISDIGKFNFTNNTKAMEFLTALAGASFKNLLEIPEFDEIKSTDYLKSIVDYRYQFDFNPTLSLFNDTQINFRMIVTEMGLCYTLNSEISRYLTYDYGRLNRWEIGHDNENIFEIHPLDGEVSFHLINVTSEANIYIHDSKDLPDIASKAISSIPGDMIQIKVSASTLFSSEATKLLNIKQRKCRYIKESNLKHSPVYSYSLCRIECRIQLSLKYCGCIPHFYRPIGSERICDVQGLHCLGNYENELITLVDKHGNIKCKCLPNCDLVNYVIESVSRLPWVVGKVIMLALENYPRMRMKRDVLFGFTDVLVYVGGMAGLLLGCSALSFAEIIYFTTIRLFWVIYYR